MYLEVDSVLGKNKSQLPRLPAATVVMAANKGWSASTSRTATSHVVVHLRGMLHDGGDVRDGSECPARYGKAIEDNNLSDWEVCSNGHGTRRYQLALYRGR
jgi:hypothetical protein